MSDVLFPEMSADNPDAEGVLATWFVDDGQTVEEGDLIAEVALDKVDMELPAPTSGTIHLLVKEGDVVPQRSVVARID